MRLLPDIIKTAEPPPPKGISASSWDRHLAGNEGFRPSDFVDVVGRLKRDKETSHGANAALGLGKAWGTLVSIAGDINAEPNRVGYGTLLSHIPDVISAERTRSRSTAGLNALKGLSAADKKVISDNLKKRLAGTVAGSVSDAALDAVLAKARQSGVSLPPLTGFAAGKGLGYLVRKGVGATTGDEPVLTRQQVEGYLKAMDVGVPLYAGKENSTAKYYPGTGTDKPLLGGVRERLIASKLPEADKGMSSKILREGGIVVPLTRTKTATAAWAKISNNFV
jgi:hypothetical protein